MGETSIHPSAVVEKGARLGAGVSIGPFCHVGPDVTLGDGVELIGSVTILGQTSLGQGGRVFPGAVLGCEPQNHAHKGGPTTLEIGKNASIREGVTMHTGTDTARGRTTIGDDCHFLAFSHVAHDCDIGNRVTLTQGAVLGGHCVVGDAAILGGLAAVHQFVRIGHHAFVGGMTGVERDLIPYGMVTGNRARLRGLNLVGMRRAGMARQDIHAVRAAYKLIFETAGPLPDRIERAREAFGNCDPVMDIIAFMTSDARRKFVMPPVAGRNRPDDGDDEA
ncbi:MAG: acyl-ACP--UDP-N-acetylglucosamine O-acyltransferase [Zhengella sp.]|uniref:acyl-ACP--UDP-N-acetylglucosamine O-acyltransferase n=1 Tax=Zhengella sp. TaxID=2282762 RepID=UPI003527A2BA|nr:acyl-ACP--UDP-N-acetylglucosamine O-acyltransferase [Brucellaceae bacterium]